MGVDIGSFSISCAIAEVTNGNPKIIGTGFAKSQGIRKGAITNIEQAARSIKSAILDAKRMSGAETNRAIISISGVYVKSRNSSGVVTIPGGEIGHKEIYRVIQGALHNATIPAEYEAIHILPYQFMVDEQEYVEDPSGMSGSRLKAMVHIVTAQKTALENLRRVIKSAGIEIENIVLSSYASSIAVLSDDERELGVACIDIGGDTCDIMIHNGNSLCYDGILPVGSNHITKDIAHACNTTPHIAEKLKIEHIDITCEQSQTFEIPTIGGEKMQQVSSEFVSKVVYARLTETLSILYGMIDQNELKSQIGGIVFTGGLTQLKGLGDLIEAFFKDYPTRIGIPKELEGMPKELQNPSFSTLVGLILYGSGRFTNYEMDSEKRLKTKKSKLLHDELMPSVENKNEDKNEALDFFKEELVSNPQKKEDSLWDKTVKKLANLF